MILAPLTPAQTRAIHLQTYPNGLVCHSCGRLLATRRESYARSNLGEAVQLAFVCAGCRLACTDPEQARQDRLAQLAAARQIGAKKRVTGAGLVTTRISPDPQMEPSSTESISSTSNTINLTAGPPPAFRGGRRGRPGRPRVAAPLKERARTYSRAYRDRQRLTRSAVPAHDL